VEVKKILMAYILKNAPNPTPAEAAANKAVYGSLAVSSNLRTKPSGYILNYIPPYYMGIKPQVNYRFEGSKKRDDLPESSRQMPDTRRDAGPSGPRDRLHQSEQATGSNREPLSASRHSHYTPEGAKQDQAARYRQEDHSQRNRQHSPHSRSRKRLERDNEDLKWRLRNLKDGQDD
jgi:hypothetical protein